MSREAQSSCSHGTRLAKQARKDTKPERQVAAALRSLGLGYRKDVRGLPGKPDFANRSRRWAIFVHGCFWHRHTGCARATAPKSNSDFWSEKFAANRCRDARAIRTLRSMGFKVMVIWECDAGQIAPRLQRSLKRVA